MTGPLTGEFLRSQDKKRLPALMPGFSINKNVKLLTAINRQLLKAVRVRKTKGSLVSKGSASGKRCNYSQMTQPCSK